MNISGSTVLVTGANRGIGAEYVRQLTARGAAKIYAGARNPSSIAAGDGIVPLALDVTDPAQISAAAQQAGDVQIVINNAGVALGQPVLGGDVKLMHDEFETNVFGPLLVSTAFAPILKANGGGTILNALSAVSWFSLPGLGAYSASKAAAWSLTDALRNELAAQGTRVVALHMGPVDTELAAQLDMDKITTAEVVTAALDGIEAGADEVLVDEITRQIKSGLHGAPSERYAAAA